MARVTKKGIFCLEGDWWNDFNRTATVKPIIKMIGAGDGINVPYLYRDVATVEEFRHYLRVWAQRKYAKYPILYLAFHGHSGGLSINRRTKIELDEIATLLEDKCAGRIIHFGSCETLLLDARHIKRFLKRTGAVAATGFRKQIDWLSSAAFDLLLFSAMQDNTLSVRGAHAIERNIRKRAPQMAREHAFRIVIRD